MNLFKNSLLCLTVFMFLSTSVSYAVTPDNDNEESGDLGHDETDIGFSEFSGRAESHKRNYEVDEAYELGKSVYHGREQGVPSFSYCITTAEGEKKKLKRKTIKSYKNTTFSKLASNLYNCKALDKHIKTDLPKSEFLHVLYYLDKRYKLNLKRE